MKLPDPNIVRIEVFYDGGCPICVWEVKLYEKLDQAKAIIWTDIETLKSTDLPPMKSREDLLGKFHVRDLVSNNEANEVWHIGVDAFARIWQVLPGFRYFAFLFKVPVIRQITMLAYLGFLRWQRRDRAKRAEKNPL